LRYFFLVISLSMIAGGAWAAGGEWPRLGMTLLFLGLGIGGQNLRTWWNHRRPRLELQGIQEDEAELLAESYQKAVTDYRYLEEARKQIGDRELERQLGRMQHISRNMLSYLEKHPKKLPAARRFIDYYQDRAAGIVRKYRELEATELTTERVAELKLRMKTALSGFDEVYAEQFERILGDQMLTADAELTVVEQHLDAEGISLEKPAEQPEMGRAEDKRQYRFSLEGMMLHLEREQGRKPKEGEALPGNCRGGGLSRRGRYSIVPTGEKSEVIKHKVIQSALAIFLGMFGAHKFYQGKTFTGVLYALFFWTSIPFWIGIVEGIRYLVMPVDDFYVEYYRKD